MTDPHRVADLKLRGPAGKIPVRVHWPKPAILVLLGEAASGDTRAHELCSETGAVVLCVPFDATQPEALDRADAVLRWAAEHGEELGADPGRIKVAGGEAATALSLRARDRGWPPVEVLER